MRSTADQQRQMSRDPETPMTLAAESVEAQSAAKTTPGIAVLRAGSTALAAAILFAPFFVGFRPTADQKEWAVTGMTTPVHAWLEAARPVVEAQGRIGDYIALPLEYLAGRIGDMWFFPFLCVGILIAIFVSIFAWWTTLDGSRVVVAPSLVYLALLPAGGAHWLPNAYAMTAAPLAVGLAAKVAMLHYSGRWKSSLLDAACVLLISASAITYELYLALFAILYVVELIFRWRGRHSGTERPITRRYLARNGAAIALAALLWGGFRYHFGSTYAGNQIPSNPLSLDTLKVTLLHILAGAMAVRSTTFELLQQASPLAIGAAAILTLATGFAFYQAPKPTRGLLWIGFGVLLAVGITLPITATDKFQGWCLDSGDCTYLDNRLSLAGLALIVVGVVSLLPRKTLPQSIAAAVVGLLAAEAFLQNAATFTERRHETEGRELLAKRYVCGDRSLGATDDIVATRLEEDGLINDPHAFHPWDNLAWRKAYWLTYINHLQQSRFWLCP